MPRIAQGPYGYFDPDAREYVITRPDTPRPWFNYLMNETYVAMISNTGGGVSYDVDPRIYRLLRYRYQNVPYDRPGRYVYVRDEETGKYWSATWAPVHMPLDEIRYECRVGTNYSIISTEHDGIRATIKYFVPMEGKQELWDCSIENVSDRPRRLSTYSYAEFAFWGAMRDLMNIDNCPNISRQHFENGAVVHHSYNDVGTGLHDMHFTMNYGFHTSTPMADEYSADRDDFIGRYRDERNPIVLETGKPTNRCEDSGYPIGSMTHRFALAPGESKRLLYRTGMHPEEAKYREEMARFDSFEKADAAWNEFKAFWDERMNRFVVKTPDEDFDAAVNSFVQYQSAMTMRLSRSISSYEWGVGRAIGYRDSSQDNMGVIHMFPEVARRFCLHLMGAVYENGQTCHNFNPLTRQFSRSDFYDDANWPAMAILEYIKETGDTALLEEQVAFCLSERTGTVYERLFLMNDFTYSKRGRNGLIQVGSADWNDGLNPGDKETESPFTTALYCASTKALVELAELRGDGEKAALMRSRYDEVKTLLNEKAWDGEWYVRLIKTDGSVLGSKDTEEFATIFLEPQPWAIMAGAVEGEKARTMLDRVDEKLGGDFGFRVMDRPFVKFDMNLYGSISVYPAGIKENGSVFNHASAWMIYAEALLGRGGNALRNFSRQAGPAKSRIAELHEVEPYVICQFVSQPPFHITGRGRNAWLSGSASWMAIGALRGILGCRPALGGLEIDPSIPAEWGGFTLKRVFRGVTYDIEVRNPDGVEHGVREMVVDGKPVDGRVIPHQAGKDRVHAIVTMG